jgi:carboxyl-terminal processing protease
MRIFRKTNPITVTIIIALLTGVIGWKLGHYNLNAQWKNYHPVVNALNAEPPPNAQNIDFALFWKVWNLVSDKYVDKKAIDPQKMYYGAIQGMVAAVGDPYTMFLPPESQKTTKEELGGSFSGVGIELGFDKDKHMVVIAPLDGTPAQKAGIQAGDIIVKINGKDSSNITLPDAVNMIRGPQGTTVTLQIYHTGDTQVKDVSLTRDTIVVKTVNYQAKKTPTGKNVAYIKLSRFGGNTNDEWQAAISTAMAAAPQGIILDLRNNPGGYLDDAVYVASEFLPTGDNVVLQEDAQGVRTPYPVNRVGKLLQLPLVVMINKGSASASEIVSGAMQDYKRGKLVGEQSFGKGTVQETQDLDGGTGIHITTAKWLTPNGRWIHQIGLTPDLPIEATSSADPAKDVQLDKALQSLDGQ